MGRKGGVLGILLLGLVACELPYQASISPNAPKLRKYTAAEIEEEALKLLLQMEVEPAYRARVVQRVHDYLAQPGFASSLDSPGINAVGGFQAGSGGFIVEGGAGGGLVSFAGGRQGVRFAMTEFSVGANIGGQGKTGVFLVVGLNHPEKFPDLYTTIGSGGAVGDLSFKVETASPERGTHVIQLVESAVGFSGKAGLGKMRITVE